ncbi:MAG: sigma-54-dependent transcriptional regulator [Pyrinomonadaceae bacterium]
MRSSHILIADDQPDVLAALRLLLKSEGYKITTAASPTETISLIKSHDFDLLLMDLNYSRDTTSGQEGFDLLERLSELDTNTPIVVMTAWGSVETAVEAMRRGARDFIRKPWDNTRLLTTLRTQLELKNEIKRGRQLEAENKSLREAAGEETKIIAESAVMKNVIELIHRIGPSDANVLLTGENGTGKGLIARILHTSSNRSKQPLIIVNVGTLSEGVFESELFGHVKGAFTDARTDRIGRFELADGGTLFLDEIANIALTHQAKLLRIIESGEFERVGSSRTQRANVRIISATNANLAREVEQDKFRQDLLFRLNTIEVYLPPLRHRREDILPLAHHFLQRHVVRYRRDVNDIEKDAARDLLTHQWPGNVRELEHSIERAVLMCRSSSLSAADFALRTKYEILPLDDMNLEEIEKVFIQKTLARHDGQIDMAAKALGLSRSGLYRRLKKFDLQ